MTGKSAASDDDVDSTIATVLLCRAVSPARIFRVATIPPELFTTFSRDSVVNQTFFETYFLNFPDQMISVIGAYLDFCDWRLP